MNPVPVHSSPLDPPSNPYLNSIIPLLSAIGDHSHEHPLVFPLGVPAVGYSDGEDVLRERVAREEQHQTFEDGVEKRGSRRGDQESTALRVVGSSAVIEQHSDPTHFHIPTALPRRRSVVTEEAE